MTAELFRDLYGKFPEAEADAPGRVNMIGDHTDYNEGFVMPIAIPQRTRVLIARGARLPHEAYSCTLRQHHRFDDTNATGFARYLAGCIGVAGPLAGGMPPLRIVVDSNVPVGIGLSSSAALEVATLRALSALLKLDLDPVQIAKLAQRAEIEYAGVQCGIMDQMASSLATTREMLLIDTRTLAVRLTPLPPGGALLVVDSGVSRNLTESAYNRRREECARAAAMLGVAALRDVADVSATDGLPSPMRERARHVVSENARVLQASRTNDPAFFGALMNQSHASLRDDYAVSVHQVDALVDALQRDQAVFGARMTGAGFGGACVALVKGTDALASVGKRLRDVASNARIVVPQEPCA